jgi:hypothetical protein
MHQTVKELRRVVRSWDGAWVRRWRDDEIWVGWKYGCDADEIRCALESAGFKALRRKPTEMFFEVSK